MKTYEAIMSVTFSSDEDEDLGTVVTMIQYATASNPRILDVGIVDVMELEEDE